MQSQRFTAACNIVGDINVAGCNSSCLPLNKAICYIASAETKRDCLIHGHVALDKCNVHPKATSEQ